MIYIVETENQTVVRNNYDIIEFSANSVDKIKILNPKNYLKVKFNRNDLIIAGALSHAFRLCIFKRVKNIAVWVQGILPEESYLRNHSKFRFRLLSFMEKVVLKKAVLLLFVSNAMKKHYEKKYKLSFLNYIIFPCFNTQICVDCFEAQKKYSNNYFAYAGGTAKWQNLDEIVEAYSSIEHKINDAKFIFMINDEQYARSLIEKYRIDNYEIKYVSKDQLPFELAKVKFGFVLREDNLINNVSTPTKLSTYLSCGVIPIFTDSIRDFNDIMANKKYKIVYKNLCFLEDVLKFTNVDVSTIKNEYLDIFNSYYSNNYYIDLITNCLRQFYEKYK